MRTLPLAMRNLLNTGGPFLGENRASSRITVQPDWQLRTTSGTVGGWKRKKLPIRYWQTAADDQVEVEVPNVQTVQIVRDLTQQAATLMVYIYNNQLGADGVRVGSPWKLGQPGYFGWNYGSTGIARERWGQTIPEDAFSWQNILCENACIRTYQGYGGQNLTIPEAVAAGNLILTGVFLLDDPGIEASTGIITLNGRDMAKLLIDQYTVPPFLPRSSYPLNYYGPDQMLNPSTVAITKKKAAVLAQYGKDGWAESRCVFNSSSQGSPASFQAEVTSTQAAINAYVKANPGAPYTNPLEYQLLNQAHCAAIAAQTSFMKNANAALDANRKTAWQSELKASAVGNIGGNPEYPWIEFDCYEETTGIFLDPMYGNYTVYVSIMENGKWVDIGLPNSIDSIPYIAVIGVPFETPNWYVFDRRYSATQIRLTFNHLHKIHDGYVAALRGFIIGQRPTLTAKTKQVTGFAVTPNNFGYHLVDASGKVTCYGNSLQWGDLSGKALTSPVIGVAAPVPGGGYWLCQQNGTVHAYGKNGQVVNGKLQPLQTFGMLHNSNDVIVAFRITMDGKGYWMVTAGGKVFAFGSAAWHGDLVSRHVAGSTIAVVDMCATEDGKGYWIMTEGGRIYAFGTAGYYGQPFDQSNDSRFVGIERTATGKGYVCVTDGGVVYAGVTPTGSKVFKRFGDAVSYGGAGGINLNAPICGIRRTNTTYQLGYYLVAEDGGVFTYGDALFFGSLQGDQALIPDYQDYSDIIKDLALWAGFYLSPGTEQITSTSSELEVVFHEGQTPKLPATHVTNNATEVTTYTYSGLTLVSTNPAHGSFDPGYRVYKYKQTITVETGHILLPYQIPQVFGIIENTGAWDTLGPLGIDFFDKRPVIDVMTDIANLVGYIVRVDEVGSFRFEQPNIWAAGNFDENDKAMVVETRNPATGALVKSPFIPTIDERTNLNDYVMTQADTNLRSPIVVAIADPYAYGGPVPGSNVTTFYPPYTAALKGIVKAAEFTVPLQVDATDQQYFAELIALRIWQSARTGTVTAWCDPSICLNDQVRVFESQTGETNVQYVNAIQTTHTLEDGKFEMQITCNWLGEFGNWAITHDLDSIFGPGVNQPSTYVVGGPTKPSTLGKFPLSTQLAIALGQSGSPKTATFLGGSGSYINQEGERA